MLARMINAVREADWVEERVSGVSGTTKLPRQDFVRKSLPETKKKSADRRRSG